MVTCKAVDRTPDRKYYKLLDSNGKTMEMEATKLKESIRSGKLRVVNLTLTSDNRLVVNKKENVDKLSLIINKAKKDGYQISKIPTKSGIDCVLASKESTHILCIPEGVQFLNDVRYWFDKVTHQIILLNEDDRYIFTNYIRNLKGYIRVIGGASLKNTISMFEGCSDIIVDLKELDTTNVEDMGYMFSEFSGEILNVESLNFNNVIYMYSMFYCCEAPLSLNLSGRKFTKLQDMSLMFTIARIEDVNLSQIYAPNLKYAFAMFNQARVNKEINMSNAYLGNLSSMSIMFSGCVAKKIDISSIKINQNGLLNIESIFSYCNSDSIILEDLSHISISDMSHAFQGCKVHQISKITFDTKSVKYANNMFQECRTSLLDLTDIKTDSINVEKGMNNMFNFCEACIRINKKDMKMKKVIAEANLLLKNVEMV